MIVFFVQDYDMNIDELRNICDDFFTIGNIAILQQNTGNDVYDFYFRNYFDCQSVTSATDKPVLLHIGAIEDYAEIESLMKDLEMRLFVSENDHKRCSDIEQWYPILKEHTPFTKVYDELPKLDELLQDFSFPFFLKGNRQTNRHLKSKCIIENPEQYERIKVEWENDPILFWQKPAIREYVPLQIIDSQSYPDMVPMSYEFRFFYFEGKCMSYGPYWYMGLSYSLSDKELNEVLKLTDWAAMRTNNVFMAVDVAKTAAGEWIIVEINDAQESGFVGVNPFTLWKNTIDAVQNMTQLCIEESFEDDDFCSG